MNAVKNKTFDSWHSSWKLLILDNALSIITFLIFKHTIINFADTYKTADTYFNTANSNYITSVYTTACSSSSALSAFKSINLLSNRWSNRILWRNSGWDSLLQRRRRYHRCRPSWTGFSQGCPTWWDRKCAPSLRYCQSTQGSIHYNILQSLVLVNAIVVIVYWLHYNKNYTSNHLKQIPFLYFCVYHKLRQSLRPTTTLPPKNIYIFADCLDGSDGENTGNIFHFNTWMYLQLYQFSRKNLNLFFADFLIRFNKIMIFKQNCRLIGRFKLVLSAASKKNLIAILLISNP